MDHALSSPSRMATALVPDSRHLGTTETTPLLTPSPPKGSKTSRSVTFHPNPVSKTIEPEPVGDIRRRNRGPNDTYLARSAENTNSLGISSSSNLPPSVLAPPLGNKGRRRNSYGSLPNLPSSIPKIGPQRSTKTTQKLKLLPNPEVGDEGPDEESGRDVYSQYTRIKDPTARRDAARLGKAHRDRLPRVTAYCTANKYRMDGLMRFLKGRGKAKGANPKLIDKCIYTPFNYAKTLESREDSGLGLLPDLVQTYERRHSTGSESADAAFHREQLAPVAEGLEPQYPDSFSRISDQGDMLAGPPLDNEAAVVDADPDFDIEVHTPEVFLFDYGVVVIWGMSVDDERKFLKDLSRFEFEPLAPEDIETENFNFYYTREYQPRIYNDFITLRDKNNYMTKLAISHALAQSVQTSLFEELIATTIERCKDIPNEIAETGKIGLTRTQINMQIGELFVLRINIHLNGSVLDTPELFWVEPQLEPLYQAARNYLEMDRRVGLLTDRLSVVGDLLAVLKDQLSHGHGEKLEWIVIVLIAAEILVAAVNIVVDLWVAD